MRGAVGAGEGAAAERPWQLDMFSKSLKKQQKLSLLRKQIGDVRGKRCLLVTHGDNNGALNYHFREQGGSWSWVENEPDHIAEMEELLGDPVALGHGGSHLPVEDAAFDVVVSIDVHEHLDECDSFNRELFRVARPGGLVVVTTPNGDPRKPVTRLKMMLGMSPEKYGHKVIGYDLAQHDRMLRDAGLEPIARGSYAGLFTELLELAINYAYVEVLSKRAGRRVKQGTIAPASHEQVRAAARPLRLYAALYPLLLLISKLDYLLFFRTGYAVSTVARRPS